MQTWHDLYSTGQESQCRDSRDGNERPIAASLNVDKKTANITYRFKPHYCPLMYSVL